MSEETTKGDGETDELPYSWKQVQTAIWLIGLAILAWQNWWWPGILVLVAISGLTEAVLRQYVTRQAQAVTAQARTQEEAQMRAAITPDACPRCGSPLTVDKVEWTGSVTGACPYCGSTVTATPKESAKKE